VAKALAYIEAQHDYFLKLGGGTEIGAKAAMAGYIMEAGFVGHVGLYYDATKVFLVGAYDGTVTYHTAII